MAGIAVLGVFNADTTYRASRMPVIGETVLGTSFTLGPGGKGSNQAIAAGRLGAEVAIITRLGSDDFAELALRTWADAGVQPLAARDPRSHTGAAFIFVSDETGDNAIISTPGTGGRITADDVSRHKAEIAAASVFITQLEQPIEAALEGLRIAREAGRTTILNPAPASDLPDGMLALCDILTPNETEAATLTGIEVNDETGAARAADALVAMGVGCPIITLGERGAFVHGHGLVPAVSAGKVVETTGAGDAFNGGLAVALSEGRNLPDAVDFAVAVAGISVTRPGAAASMPSREEVDALRENAT